MAVWRCIYLYPSWQENDSLPGTIWERLHSQWQAEGCECGGDLHRLDNASLRKGCGLRLPELEIDGTEEGGPRMCWVTWDNELTICYSS